MKRLSREAFERAVRFLKTQARPLDRALFEYRFENASAENGLAELVRFQNKDGGFGSALEPDLRTPSSSALATGIGLGILKELDVSPQHPMVRGAVEYLLASYNADTAVWRVAPLDTNDFPHAPWWHDQEGSLAKTFDGFRIIPRAWLVASLHHFAPLVPTDWLDVVTARTATYIETVAQLGGGGGDDLEYAISLAETSELSPHYRERLTTRIRRAIPLAVEHDTNKWNSYVVTPLKIIHSPRSLGAELIWDILQTNLDYMIERQTLDGTWDPTWTWGEMYPDTWERAKREWRGHLTLETLSKLHAFGRIENS